MSLMFSIRSPIHKVVLVGIKPKSQRLGIRHPLVSILGNDRHIVCFAAIVQKHAERYSNRNQMPESVPHLRCHLLRRCHLISQLYRNSCRLQGMHQQSANAAVMMCLAGRQKMKMQDEVADHRHDHVVNDSLL